MRHHLLNSCNKWCLTCTLHVIFSLRCLLSVMISNDITDHKHRSFICWVSSRFIGHHLGVMSDVSSTGNLHLKNRELSWLPKNLNKTKFLQTFVVMLLAVLRAHAYSWKSHPSFHDFLTNCFPFLVQLWKICGLPRSGVLGNSDRVSPQVYMYHYWYIVLLFVVQFLYYKKLDLTKNFDSKFTWMITSWSLINFIVTVYSLS